MVVLSDVKTCVLTRHRCASTRCPWCRCRIARLQLATCQYAIGLVPIVATVAVVIALVRLHHPVGHGALSSSKLRVRLGFGSFVHPCCRQLFRHKPWGDTRASSRCHTLCWGRTLATQLSRSLAGGTVSRFHFSLITEFDLATTLMITPRLTISVGHFQLGAHTIMQERGNFYPSFWLWTFHRRLQFQYANTTAHCCLGSLPTSLCTLRFTPTALIPSDLISLWISISQFWVHATQILVHDSTWEADSPVGMTSEWDPFLFFMLKKLSAHSHFIFTSEYSVTWLFLFSIDIADTTCRQFLFIVQRHFIVWVEHHIVSVHVAQDSYFTTFDLITHSAFNLLRRKQFTLVFIVFISLFFQHNVVQWLQSVWVTIWNT